ncbi:hypothetical protein ABIF94_002494 [Bradyrhizobium ottawaense]|uniref:DUF3883 domain-containing protein n=1 Tax=Bradyrhizobium ottawaense TaxID=931866 RepID=UPI003833595C
MFERFDLSMSAIEALRIVRSYMRNDASLSVEQAAQIARKLEANGVDYPAAATLDMMVPFASVDVEDAVAFYRSCVEIAVLSNPIWMKIIPLGRQKFVQKLDRDAASCFRCARLLDEPPSDEVVDWWDRLQSMGRRLADQARLEQGREAERLSLLHEEARLKALGISRSPRWMSIEDNTVGYDILSYDPGAIEPVARLIEVKSFRKSGRFFLSRNEWETAKKFGDVYSFHIWDVDSKQLSLKSVDEVNRSIPTDNPGGQWDVAVIDVNVKVS